MVIKRTIRVIFVRYVNCAYVCKKDRKGQIVLRKTEDKEREKYKN
jgi:hypothetical protein